MFLHDNMSLKYIPPNNPYIVKPVFSGILFDPKDGLLVLVRKTSPRWLLRVPTIYVLRKNMEKISKFFIEETSIFTSLKSLCILHGRVNVMK